MLQMIAVTNVGLCGISEDSFQQTHKVDLETNIYDGYYELPIL